VKTRSEFSAGGVVIRRDGESVEVALAARRTRKGDLAWGLPKGLVEPEEQPQDAALREVREETGLDARILSSLGEISYWYVWGEERVRKRVAFFLMEQTGGDISQHDHEMEEIRWFPLAAASRQATYPTERTLLRQTVEALSEKT
jgi:8-oxo-dGTP pyrophosphatase MutT (NUDIX family)